MIKYLTVGDQIDVLSSSKEGANYKLDEYEKIILNLQQNHLNPYYSLLQGKLPTSRDIRKIFLPGHIDYGLSTDVLSVLAFKLRMTCKKQGVDFATAMLSSETLSPTAPYTSPNPSSMHLHRNLRDSLIVVLTAELLLDLSSGLAHFVRTETKTE